MTITQRFNPPFALADVDGVALNFDPVVAPGQLLTSPVVVVSGGFTVGTPQVGTVDETTGAFTEGASGTYIYVLLTATEVGKWEVTFTCNVTGGRLLHRTEYISVVSARS